MKPSSQVTCMVIDLGFFVDLARTLAKTYKKVYYCYPSWVCPAPRMNNALIGYGFDEIEVVLSPFDHFEDIDLYVFTDVGLAGMQLHFEMLGKKVWGSRKAGEDLEFYRDSCKELMKKIGLPVMEYEVLKGVDSLRDYLKGHKDRIVKLDIWRGLFETFKAPYYDSIEPVLDRKEYELGAFKYITDFLVEEELKDRFEVAIDTWNIDGELPKNMYYGCEIKDTCYIAKFTSYDKVPEPIKQFDKAIAPYLAKYGYRSFYSPETRIGEDHVPYMIDLASRCPRPGTEVYEVTITNLADVIWHGANGECIEPACIAKWAVEILVHSPWAAKNWQPMKVDKEYEEYVKYINAVKIEGKTYVVPQTEEYPEIAVIVGYGDTIDEAMKMGTEIAESVKGYSIEIPIEKLDEAKTEIEKAKEMGVWVKE